LVKSIIVIVIIIFLFIFYPCYFWVSLVHYGKEMTEVAIPAPTGSASSYGVHLLVDFRPIEEADQLLEDCKQYVAESQQELYVVPFVPTFSRLVSNVRQWRMKRKDARLQSVYDGLLPRVSSCEKELRGIIGDVVEKKSALRLQAKHLQVRLNACIAHNQEQLADSDAPLDETRNYVNLLSDEQTSLKQMLVFNAEVSRLKAAEANAKRHQAMRWGGLAKNRNNMNNNKKTTAESAADMKDEHHSAIEQRLKTCRTVCYISFHLICIQPFVFFLFFLFFYFECFPVATKVCGFVGSCFRAPWFAANERGQLLMVLGCLKNSGKARRIGRE
jgi:hypothetical protein